MGVKQQFVANNAKNESSYQNSIDSSVVQNDKIYLLCDFRDDRSNIVGVIAL